MVYSKQTWNDGVSGQTPINATRLNNIEQGIADAMSVAEGAVSTSSQTLTTAQKTQVKQNLGIVQTSTGFAGSRTVSDPILTDAQATSLYGEGSYFTVDNA